MATGLINIARKNPEEGVGRGGGNGSLPYHEDRFVSDFPGTGKVLITGQPHRNRSPYSITLSHKNPGKGIGYLPYFQMGKSMRDG
jgi:hypothetical protein